jgi:5-(carboxyamino)imidazole ribonucleotide synthase
MFQDLKIGVLGGGQLGAMLMQEAINYGLTVCILDKSPEAPCSRYTKSFQVGDPMSYDDVVTFGKVLDIITIEMEAVNIPALKYLQKLGVKVYPSPNVISIIQNKYIQKRFLQSSNIPVANGIGILNRADLYNHIDKLPGCLKKCREGYDGTGVMILRTEADIEKAFDDACVLEELVQIEHEISVIVARNEAGDIKCYDPVMMMFNKERFVLDYQLCPANITPEIASQARDLAIKIADACGLTGILAVEMFITTDGRLLVNELAPRPHNSGHHTIEACTTSQYGQLIRAILGLPLGETSIHKSSVMVNLLQPAASRQQNMQQTLSSILAMADVHLHWYGKKGNREGRKIGHITITDSTVENAITKAEKVRNILNQ